MTREGSAMEYEFSASNFSFWDFIINIIPGTLALLMIASLLPARYISTRIGWIMDAGILVLFLLLIVGYVGGWVVHEVARLVDGFINDTFDITNPVKEKLDEARADQKDDRDSIERRYLEGAQLYFYYDDVGEYSNIQTLLDDFELFGLTIEYLISNNIGRTYRFYVLFTLMRNLYVLFGIGLLGHLLVLLLTVTNIYNPIWSSYELAFVVGGLIVVIWVTHGLRRFFQENMVEWMVADFYIAELV
jgi:hypothetical protein